MSEEVLDSTSAKKHLLVRIDFAGPTAKADLNHALAEIDETFEHLLRAIRHRWSADDLLLMVGDEDSTADDKSVFRVTIHELEYRQATPGPHVPMLVFNPWFPYQCWADTAQPEDLEALRLLVADGPEVGMHLLTAVNFTHSPTQAQEVFNAIPADVRLLLSRVTVTHVSDLESVALDRIGELLGVETPRAMLEAHNRTACDQCGSSALEWMTFEQLAATVRYDPESQANVADLMPIVGAAARAWKCLSCGNWGVFGATSTFDEGPEP